MSVEDHSNWMDLLQLKNGSTARDLARAQVNNYHHEYKHQNHTYIYYPAVLGRIMILERIRIPNSIFLQFETNTNTKYYL